MLKRLSYLVGIYEGLQVHFADLEQWISWICKPNRDFSDAFAQDRMVTGVAIDLAVMRCYLDSGCVDFSAPGDETKKLAQSVGLFRGSLDQACAGWVFKK